MEAVHLLQRLLQFRVGLVKLPVVFGVRPDGTIPGENLPALVEALDIPGNIALNAFERPGIGFGAPDQKIDAGAGDPRTGQQKEDSRAGGEKTGTIQEIDARLNRRQDEAKGRRHPGGPRFALLQTCGGKAKGKHDDA